MLETYFIEIPLEGTRWENLAFDEYYNMSDEERQEFREYLENINAPFGSDLDDEDISLEAFFITWRDIVSMSNEGLEDYNRYLDARAMAPPTPEVECDNYDDCPF